jgi:serine/threonine-protein kinase
MATKTMDDGDTGGSPRDDIWDPDHLDALGRPVDDPLWRDRVLDDRYRIRRLLGEGGMGAVFVAEQLALRKLVAIKVIRGEYAVDPEAAGRFTREAMASAALEHPHVVGTFDYGTLPEGGAYLVMPVVRGARLFDLLRDRGGLGWRASAEIAFQIADALAAAHQAGIVHRDLKPENVLVEERDDGTLYVRVLDFGIASVLIHEPARNAVIATGPQPTLTRVGTVMGTPGYMPPEQAMGERVDGRADLYALGVILWEVAVGRRLFEATTLPAIVKQQLAGAPPPVRPLRSRTDADADDEPGAGEPPAAFDGLVRDLLREDRGDRPASAGEVRERLRRMLLDTLRPPAAPVEDGAPGGADPASFEEARTESLPWSAAPAPVAILARRGEPRTGEAAAPGDPSERAGASNDLGREAESADGNAQALVPAEPPTVRTPRQVATTTVAAALAAGLAAAGAVGLVGGRIADAVGAAARDLRDATAAAVATTTPSSGPAPEDQGGPRRARARDGVDERLELILTHRNPLQREEAANWLLEVPDQGSLAPFVESVAVLEAGGMRCREKHDALDTLRALRDTRALPVVERLHRLPRQGCGDDGSADCYGCIREQIERTVFALRQAARFGGP